MLPEWIARVFPPLIVGLYVAAVLAASMSTIDSPLLVASSALAPMPTGALCIPIYKVAVPLMPEWGPVLSKAEELGPSFLLSLRAGVVVTLMATTHPLDGPHAGAKRALSARQSRAAHSGLGKLRVYEVE